TRKRARFSPPEEGTARGGAARRSAGRLTFHLRLHRFGHRAFGAFAAQRSLRSGFASVAEPLPFARTAPLAVVPAAAALHHHGGSFLERVDPDGQITDHV